MGWFEKNQKLNFQLGLCKFHAQVYVTITKVVLK